MTSTSIRKIDPNPSFLSCSPQEESRLAARKRLRLLNKCNEYRRRINLSLGELRNAMVNGLIVPNSPVYPSPTPLSSSDLPNSEELQLDKYKLYLLDFYLKNGQLPVGYPGEDLSDENKSLYNEAYGIIWKYVSS